MKLKIYISAPDEEMKAADTKSVIQMKAVNLSVLLALKGVKSKFYFPQEYIGGLFPHPSRGEKRMIRQMCNQIIAECDAIYVCGAKKKTVKTDLRLASEKELFVIRDEYLQTDIEQILFFSQQSIWNTYRKWCRQYWHGVFRKREK